MERTKEALAVKYRPKTFKELIGQDVLVEELKGLIKTGAYKYMNSIIISAGSGMGKTTTARILSKALNCKNKNIEKRPCNKCEHCKQVDRGTYPDYLELDATSYRGVKEIEPLKALASQFPIYEGGVRIIYLDEAHTLSNQAWDVLLKLLEEGKNSTLFIFATTQLHSIRPAIINRSQVFKMKPIKRVDMVLELQRIVKEEGIRVKKELLENIARVNSKGMRDAIAGLDTLYKTHGKDLEDIKIDRIASDEDKLIQIFLTLADKGVVEANIELELLDINPKEFNRVLTNVIIALYLSKGDKYEKDIEDLGVSFNLIYEFKTKVSDIDKLVSKTASYVIDSVDKMKLYLLLIEALINENKVKIDKVESIKEAKGSKVKRSGLKVEVKKKLKKDKPKKKKSKNSLGDDFEEI